MNHFYIIILFFICTNLWASSLSYYSPAKLTHHKTFHFKVDSQYFISSGQYDFEGIEEEINEGSSYTRIDSNIDLSYGIGRRIEIGGGARFRQLSSTENTNSDALTAAGVESFWGKIRYAFRPVGNFQYTLGLQYLATAYSNTELLQGETLEEMDLGDAGSQITSSLYIDYYRTKGHYLTGSLSYNLPANNLSAEILYKLESVWVSNSWSFLVGVEGVSSMNEEQIDEETSRSTFNTGNTKQFNSINRAYALPYVGFNLSIGDFLIGIRYAQSMYEISTDKVEQYTLSLDWNSKKSKYFQSKKISSFKEYDTEASVIKISPRGRFVKIDKGTSDDIETGKRFDIYQTDFFGKNKLLAAGIIIETSASWSIVKLIKRYRNTPVKKGYTARGY